MYTSDWNIWKGIFLRWHCSDVRYLHLTCHLFVFVRLNSSQCHFILPGFPHLPQHKPTSEVIEMEMKREKKILWKRIFTHHIPCPCGWQCFPFIMWAPEGIMLQPQYCVLKKAKRTEKRKADVFSFVLFVRWIRGRTYYSVYNEMRWLHFLSFFFAKCEYSTYSICGTRECYVLLTQKMLMLRT